MLKLLFRYFGALLLVLTGAHSWAAMAASPEPMLSPDGGCGETPNCITHTFSPGNNSFLYVFSDSSSLLVNFVNGVTRTFDLTITDRTFPDSQLASRLDPTVFPANTTCFHYFGSPGMCHEYAFTGDAGGPNGVPVKNVDYRPPIHLRLTYFTPDQAYQPKFGHAPGESSTFSEDILVDYFRTIGEDDTMDGVEPSMSSVIALNQPLAENDTFCWVSPQSGQTFHAHEQEGREQEGREEEGTEVSVAFRLFASGSCTGNPGPALRDRTARLSVMQLGTGQFVPLRSDEGGDSFHFDNDEKVNELEFSTAGLAPGSYVLTVRSTKFPVQSRVIFVVP